MAQVIVYENGNAIGGEGHPTYARDITFENEGTDLEAETAQAAIVEVNEKTKHGIVELWVNPSPTSDFAGQTFTFSSKGYNLDSVILELGYISGSELRVSNTIMCEIGGKAEPRYVSMGGQSKITVSYRNYSVSESSGTISVTVTDCTSYTQNNIGTNATSSTTNGVLVVNRILGLIHND